MIQITIICFALIISLANVALCDKPIFCYHTNWSQYRNGPARFYPENIDPFLCSHIIYSFASLDNGVLSAYEWNDESNEWMKGMYERTIDLKKINPSLKILIAAGGWNLGSRDFSTMVNNDALRANFVQNSVQFLKKHGFDGLDLDWEYPGSREGSRPSDKTAFASLCKELKAAYVKNGLMLTAAVGVGKPIIDTAYDVGELSKSLDYIHLMSYDLHGSWETFLGHHTALYPRKDESPEQQTLNIDFAVNYWIQQGAKPSQLVLGLATYARTFRLPYGSNQTDLGSLASGDGSAGEHTREPGFLSYYEVCQKLSQGWKKYYNNEQKIVYIHNRNQWVGYDDINTLSTKVNYIRTKGLAGAMFWALDLDDFSGNFCGMGKYPLINHVKRELNINNGLNTSTSTAELSTSTPLDKTTTKPITTSTAELSTSTPLDKTTTKPIITSTAELSTSTVYQITTPNIPPTAGCYKGDGYYPDLQSGCKNFYVCYYTGTAYEKIVFFPCSPGTLFNSKFNNCDYAHLVNCQ